MWLTLKWMKSGVDIFLKFLFTQNSRDPIHRTFNLPGFLAKVRCSRTFLLKVFWEQCRNCRFFMKFRNTVKKSAFKIVKRPNISKVTFTINVDEMQEKKKNPSKIIKKYNFVKISAEGFPHFLGFFTKVRCS